MIRMAHAAAVAVTVLVTATGAKAFDRDEGRGWGAYYNNHLSSYDGRPVGPPLPSLPRGYQYYNNQLIVGAGPSPWGDPYPTYAAPPHGPRYVAGPHATGSVRILRKRKAPRHR
jgi:hypothetical protein